MSSLSIITYPNPILKQTCSNITVFDEKLEKLIEEMFELMTEYNGVGLAAPQIGILQNLFVLNFKKRRFALINPVIIYKEGSEIKEEGCLSCPGFGVEIERATKITVQAFNPKGKAITLKEKDFIARIIQHETDHLFGTVILDKGEPIPFDED
jgi:peptide deformylase